MQNNHTTGELGEPIKFNCGCKNMSIKDRLEGKEPEVNKFCTIHNPSTTEEWEKRFDNRFWLHRVPRFTKQSNDIKEFIRECISSAKQEERGRVYKVIYDEIYGANDATIWDVLQRIKSLN